MQGIIDQPATLEFGTMTIRAYAKLNARLSSPESSVRYEAPLRERLSTGKLAEVVGSRPVTAKSGEILYRRIDIDMFDLKRANPDICDCLSECGAPVGSSLDFELDGVGKSYAFGNWEGLALYLRRSDLSGAKFADDSMQKLIDQLSSALGDRVAMQSHWDGKTELALYFYGESFVEMQYLMHSTVVASSYCVNSRTIQITPKAG